MVNMNSDASSIISRGSTITPENISPFQTSINSSEEVHILLLGAPGTGKTRLQSRYTLRQFVDIIDESAHRMGAHKYLRMLDGVNVHLIIQELSGDNPAPKSTSSTSKRCWRKRLLEKYDAVMLLFNPWSKKSYEWIDATLIDDILDTGHKRQLTKDIVKLLHGTPGQNTNPTVTQGTAVIYNSIQDKRLPRRPDSSDEDTESMYSIDEEKRTGFSKRNEFGDERRKEAGLPQRTKTLPHWTTVSKNSRQPENKELKFPDPVVTRPRRTGVVFDKEEPRRERRDSGVSLESDSSTSSRYSGATTVVGSQPRSFNGFEHPSMKEVEHTVPHEATIKNPAVELDFPVLVVATMTDRLQENGGRAQRVVTATQGQQLARQFGHNSGYIEVSARSNANVDEAFGILVDQVMTKRRREHGDAMARARLGRQITQEWAFDSLQTSRHQSRNNRRSCMPSWGQLNDLMVSMPSFVTVLNSVGRALSSGAESDSIQAGEDVWGDKPIGPRTETPINMASRGKPTTRLPGQGQRFDKLSGRTMCHGPERSGVPLSRRDDNIVKPTPRIKITPAVNNESKRQYDDDAVKVARSQTQISAPVNNTPRNFHDGTTTKQPPIRDQTTLSVNVPDRYRTLLKVMNPDTNEIEKPPHRSISRERTKESIEKDATSNTKIESVDAVHQRPPEKVVTEPDKHTKKSDTVVVPKEPPPRYDDVSTSALPSKAIPPQQSQRQPRQQQRQYQQQHRRQQSSGNIRMTISTSAAHDYVDNGPKTAMGTGNEHHHRESSVSVIFRPVTYEPSLTEGSQDSFVLILSPTKTHKEGLSRDNSSSSTSSSASAHKELGFQNSQAAAVVTAVADATVEVATAQVATAEVARVVTTPPPPPIPSPSSLSSNKTGGNDEDMEKIVERIKRRKMTVEQALNSPPPPMTETSSSSVPSSRIPTPTPFKTSNERPSTPDPRAATPNLRPANPAPRPATPTPRPVMPRLPLTVAVANNSISTTSTKRQKQGVNAAAPAVTPAVIPTVTPVVMPTAQVIVTNTNNNNNAISKKASTTTFTGTAAAAAAVETPVPVITPPPPSSESTNYNNNNKTRVGDGGNQQKQQQQGGGLQRTGSTKSMASVLQYYVDDADNEETMMMQSTRTTLLMPSTTPRKTLDYSSPLGLARTTSPPPLPATPVAKMAWAFERREQLSMT